MTVVDSGCDNVFYGTDSDGNGKSGILHSYNYPFDYRNNLHCRYIIELYQPQSSPLSYEICFEFQRFSLEPCVGVLRDYMSFEDESTGESYKYCWHGEATEDTEVQQWQNVWHQDFCCKLGHVIELALVM